MNSRDHIANDDESSNDDVPSEPSTRNDYLRVFRVGSAQSLVRGYRDGKYSDGYTGYYWER